MLSMVGMPMFGLLADRIGKRALLMTIGSALLVPPFLMLPYWSSGVILPRIGLPFIGTILSAGAPLDAVVAMAMLGVAFALVPAVLWPAVTYLVPDARLGSAYALMTFCQQIGWAGMSWGSAPRTTRRAPRRSTPRAGSRPCGCSPRSPPPASSSRSSSGARSAARARTASRRAQVATRRERPGSPGRGSRQLICHPDPDPVSCDISARSWDQGGIFDGDGQGGRMDGGKGRGPSSSRRSSCAARSRRLCSSSAASPSSRPSSRRRARPRSARAATRPSPGGARSSSSRPSRPSAAIAATRRRARASWRSACGCSRRSASGSWAGSWSAPA